MNVIYYHPRPSTESKKLNAANSGSRVLNMVNHLVFTQFRGVVWFSTNCKYLNSKHKFENRPARIYGVSVIHNIYTEYTQFYFTISTIFIKLQLHKKDNFIRFSV